MRQLTSRREERGAATIVLVIAFTCLIAAAGLGIDTSSLVFERSRIQHSADTAAIAIAYDCVQKRPACTNGGALSTADYFANQNSDGGTASIPDPATVSTAAGTAQVKVDKTIPTKFFGVLGINTKDVSAKARAIWGKNPISGPVLPYSVSLCQYLSAAVGTPTILRTDVNNVMQDKIVTKNNQPATEAYANMAPYLLSPACTVPGDVKAIVPGIPNQVSMLLGGLWMSDGGSSYNNGKLLPTQILESLDSVDGFNANQANKFKVYLAPSKVLLFAIYAPRGNYDHAGLRLSGTDAAWNGTIDMKVIGYAPFEVSGWCLVRNNNGSLAVCGGSPPGSVGIAGKFIDSVQKDPDFEYGDGGTDFGAHFVELRTE